MRYEGPNQEYFEVVNITSENCYLIKPSKNSELSMLWFDSDQNRLKIDGEEHACPPFGG